jgi:RecA/RadA recombinase
VTSRTAITCADCGFVGCFAHDCIDHLRDRLAIVAEVEDIHRARVVAAEQARDRAADERDDARRRLHEANNTLAGLLLALDAIADVLARVQSRAAVGYFNDDALSDIAEIVAECRSTDAGEGGAIP